MRILGMLRATCARLAASLRAIFDTSREDDDLRAELEGHLAMHIEENLRRGMSLDEARRDALLASGGMTLAAEAARERRGFPHFEQLVADCRHAVGAPPLSAPIRGVS
jgi:hypothetical protein